MSKSSLYFVHRCESPFIQPVKEYIREFGIRKSKGTTQHSLDMHYNDGIEICYVLKGVFKWQVGDHFHQVYPGDIFITNPWEWHGSPDDVLDRGIIAWLILRPQHFLPDGELRLGPWSRLSYETQKALGQLLVKRQSHILKNGPNLADEYRNLYTEIQDKKSGWKEESHLILDGLMIALLRLLEDQQYKTDSGDSDYFAEKFEKVMQESFSSKLNMEELAFSFGMSSSSFNKRVKALTGFSPAEYQLALKINESKCRLRHTQEKVIDVALGCGFCSSQHFSSQFLKFTGFTPSDYRAKYAE